MQDEQVKNSLELTSIFLFYSMFPKLILINSGFILGFENQGNFFVELQTYYLNFYIFSSLSI